MRCLIFIFFIFVRSSLAEEPGHFEVETAPAPRESPSPSPLTNLRRDRRSQLGTEFAKASGLKADQALTLDVQRISCNRRIFSPSGLSLEGEADLKVAHTVADLFEIEFPSYLFFGDHNPYHNGIDNIETVPGRQLVNMHDWQDGESLRVSKNVVLVFADDKTAPQTVPAVDEFRVIGETYPPTLIVRETIFAEKNFAIYWICQ